MIPGVSLATHSGSLTLSSGAVSNLHVTGSLYITGSNVTLSNVKVDGTIFINESQQGVISLPVPANIRLVHVEFRDMYSYGFAGLTIDYCNSHSAQNGPNAQLFDYRQGGKYYPASNLVITNSWFHDPAPSTTTAHIETLHINGIQGVTLRNNILDERAPDANTRAHVTAVVAFEGTPLYGVASSNVTIDHNVFHGGGYYQLYMIADGGNSVTNNQFFSDSGDFAAVQYPPNAYNASALTSGQYNKFSQSGNTLDGKPVSLPGGK